MTDVMTTELLASQMYAAYGNHANWTNFTGGPMPRWQDLPQATREHWIAVAQYIFDALANTKVTP